jgi:hypothetical protein
MVSGKSVRWNKFVHTANALAMPDANHSMHSHELFVATMTNIVCLDEI